MRHGMISAVTLATVMLSAPVQGGAQDVGRTLRVGQAVSGTLAAQDPRYGPRGAFHAYRLDAKAGTRYQVTMQSDDVDAYVWAARVVGGLTEEIAADDDGGGETDARLRFRATAAGTYLIVAQSLEVAAVGGYALRVEELPPSPPPTTIALRIGEAKEGVLDDRSALLEDGAIEVPYQIFTFTGRGERVRVAVRSGAFDAAMRVTRVTPAGEEEVGTDDDSGGGTDAQMVFIANGEFRVYAKPLEADKSGPFTVSISEMQVRPVASRPLTIGQTTEGTIESSDPELEDGRNFHQYAVTARPGERLTITLRSGAFDAFLDWGSVGPGGFESASSDDDSGGGTDARLDVVMPADGTYVIRAHGLERGKFGAYTLIVERRSSK